MPQAQASCNRQKVTAANCHACGHSGLEQFYHVPAVPVHSCLLMNTRDEALAHPRGELRLAQCEACGFITNLSYDPSHHNYFGQYEETQGFSPTFNTFTRTLVKRLIDRYDLRGRTAMEIGCGKGEFLALLCEQGENRGIGVDPSFVPGRLPPDMESRLTVYREFYGEQHFSLSPDFICCRHTLEHIPLVRDFILGVRKSIGSKATPLFFDLPDVRRVLIEGAFWDLYYEHCSYFSLGSLARLFRACAFDVTDIDLDYDDQWLMLEAVPAGGPTQPALSAENDLDEIVRAVRDFAARCGSIIRFWREKLDALAAQGARTVVWGSGSKGVAFLTTLGIDEQLEYVVDINPHKHGRFMPGTGHEIVGPDDLVNYKPTHVVVMNPIYCDEIRRDLLRRSIDAELMPVWSETLIGAT